MMAAVLVSLIEVGRKLDLLTKIGLLYCFSSSLIGVKKRKYYHHTQQLTERAVWVGFSSSSLQSTGAYKAASRLASATPPPAHVLSRGIGWQVYANSVFVYSEIMGAMLVFSPQKVGGSMWGWLTCVGHVSSG